MQKINLHIKTPFETQTVSLEDEISIGRTNLARIVLSDTGLSRLNTSFFLDEGAVFVVDENSLNGTFLNGEKLSNQPRRVYNGDTITLGSETKITVEIAEVSVTAFDSQTNRTKADQPEFSEPQNHAFQPPPKEVPKNPADKPPMVLILAAVSTCLIIFLSAIAIFLVSIYKTDSTAKKPNQTARASNSDIPVRVQDPLGVGDPEDLDLDDLMSFWDVQEEPIEASELEEVKSETAKSNAADLNVSVDFWEQQRALALGSRAPFATGVYPAGIIIPKEVRPDGVVKQTAKIREMVAAGYQLPLDFADLAQRKMNGELVELPMATKDFVLEVGGSSTEGAFTSFSFETNSIITPPGSEDFQIISKLAGNFDGQKYDMNNGRDRRQMKIRMLRMFNQNAKPVLERLAKAYREKFNRPLRVTSLSRSMEYQISLNKGNSNSYRVRGKGSFPPHTSGCTFDLARKHMTAEEQNFVMQQLAEMENQGILDALIEGGTNACFHVFIYPDGKPPVM